MTTPYTSKILPLLLTLATHVINADNILVTNSAESTYWIGIFYTYMKNGKKILVQDQNGEWPEIYKIHKTNYDNYNNLNKLAIPQTPLRLRDGKGKVTLWYDRDLIAFNPNGFKEFNSQSRHDEIAFLTNQTRIGGDLRDLHKNIDGYWLNVGTTRFVSEAEITTEGIINTYQ